eukprot:201579-Rhodomonas_salina.1
MRNNSFRGKRHLYAQGGNLKCFCNVGEAGTRMGGWLKRSHEQSNVAAYPGQSSSEDSNLKRGPRTQMA